MLQVGMRERHGSIKLAYSSDLLERIFQYCFEDHLQNHQTSRVRRRLFNDDDDYLSVPPASTPPLGIPMRNSLPDHHSVSVSLSPTSPRSALSSSSPNHSLLSSWSPSASPLTSPSKPKKGVRRTPVAQASDPVVICFAMSHENVMEYLMAAHFLDIPPLVDSAARMIAENIEGIDFTFLLSFVCKEDFFMCVVRDYASSDRHSRVN